MGCYDAVEAHKRYSPMYNLSKMLFIYPTVVRQKEMNLENNTGTLSRF